MKVCNREGAVNHPWLPSKASIARRWFVRVR